MNILVIGDQIIDRYRWCKATRLCPEAPVPVLQQIGQTEERKGGAGLVYDNLCSLSQGRIRHLNRTVSYKERIFAGQQLVARLDRDGIHKFDAEGEKLWIPTVEEELQEADVIVVSDYNKGTMTPSLAQKIVHSGKMTFVDAKTNWEWYRGAFAFFPNEHEVTPALPALAKHVIAKQGEKGCLVDGLAIPGHRVEVRDVTGAGDVFMAAFVSEYLRDVPGQLQIAAQYANKAASISVKHLGTYIVKPEDLQ